LSRFRSNSKPTKASSLRLIGGKHRGRKLPIPALDGLRPTSDRIRETLFNWLQFNVPGARILDLFAGTGALGLEALSRGASEAIFVEPQQVAANAIGESLHMLGQTNASVIHQSSERFLSTSPSPFDLVFIDPPFALDLWQGALNSLCQQNWLKEDALVYVECPKNQLFDIPDALSVVKDKTAGQVRYRLLKNSVAS
jgi:16S rRNA (guanine966-N2)-methyltransferase